MSAAAASGRVGQQWGGVHQGWMKHTEEADDNDEVVEDGVGSSASTGVGVWSRPASDCVPCTIELNPLPPRRTRSVDVVRLGQSSSSGGDIADAVEPSPCMGLGLSLQDDSDSAQHQV